LCDPPAQDAELFLRLIASRGGYNLVEPPHIVNDRGEEFRVLLNCGQQSRSVEPEFIDLVHLTPCRLTVRLRGANVVSVPVTVDEGIAPPVAVSKPCVPVPR